MGFGRGFVVFVGCFLPGFFPGFLALRVGTVL
jgi:hypothetical protein